MHAERFGAARLGESGWERVRAPWRRDLWWQRPVLPAVSPVRAIPRPVRFAVAGQQGQAIVELAVMTMVLAILVLAILLGSQLLARDVALNGASRVGAFAASHSASTQYALGTVTPNPTVVAQAVGTAVTQDIPGVAPTMAITPSAVLVDAGNGHTFAMPFYQVTLRAVYQSPVALFPSVPLASTSGAPVAPAIAGSGALPTSTPTVATCWVDLNEFQPYSNPMPPGTGFYQVVTAAPSGSILPVEARWNVVGSTVPISPTGALTLALYSGTPFGNGYGTLTEPDPPGSATPVAQATSTSATSGGQVPTLETSPGVAPSGTAATYTVVFFNGSSATVTTAPPGIDPDQQGAQVQFSTNLPSSCAS